MSTLLRQKLCLRSLHIPLRPLRPPPRNLSFPRPTPTNFRSYSQFPQTRGGERDRAAVGVFTPKAAVLFVAAGVGLFFYFRHEKEKLLQARQKELEASSVGRAHVGGPFTLTTHHNTPFSELDLLGKWSLVYFGFTNCPDICPAELDKIGVVVDSLNKDLPPALLQPLFISVDPARDTAPRLAAYLSSFHPSLTGLFGSYAATKATCKAYRVYFSTPPDADPKGDYLVDHSIFVYLMDPRGEFVEAFGQNVSAAEVVERVRKEVEEWERVHGKKN